MCVLLCVYIQLYVRVYIYIWFVSSSIAKSFTSSGNVLLTIIIITQKDCTSNGMGGNRHALYYLSMYYNMYVNILNLSWMDSLCIDRM